MEGVESRVQSRLCQSDSTCCFIDGLRDDHKLSCFQSWQEMAASYLESFCADALLSAVDKAAEVPEKEAFLHEAASSMVELSGLPATEPEGSTDCTAHLPEGLQSVVERIASFNKAVTCLLDPQPLCFGCSVKDVFKFGRYTGSEEPEACLKENLRKNPFWKKLYEASLFVIMIVDYNYNNNSNTAN